MIENASIRNATFFNWGVRAMIVSGFFPILVGSKSYLALMSKLSVDHWLSVFAGRTYTNGTLPPVDSSFYVLSHMGFTNLIATGVSLSCLSFFVVRKGQIWGWWLYAFIILWVGINDSILSVWQYEKYMKSNSVFPVPLFPLTLGIFGLISTWPRLNRDRRSNQLRQVKSEAHV